MSRQFNYHQRLLQLGLLLPLMVGGMCGCNGSAPTLSLPSPNPNDQSNVTSVGNDEVSTESPVSTPAADTSTKPPSTETAAPASKPERAALLTKVDADQLVGSWQDSFYGSRTLTLNADGTAQMRLNFDFAASLLYGKQVDFDLKWSLEGAIVKVDILSGKPAEPAKSLMDTWGSHHSYLLDRVEPDVVEMRESTQNLPHTLRRIRAAESP